MGLFDSKSIAGEMYESFTPADYTAELSALNPMIWNQLNADMSGQPSLADWQNRSAGLRSVQQQYRDAQQLAGMDFGARGLGDSGWQSQRQGQLLGERASSQADVISQFFQTILDRQTGATATAADYLACAQAGSGTYTVKEWV